MNSPYRILVIGPSWVGDMMMAQSLFMLLKSRHANCLIDVLAPGWSLPLLAHMPEVSAAIDSPFQHGEAALRERYLLGKSLRDRQYDQAIVLPNSFKSALIPYWARIPLRTGFVGEIRYGLLNDSRKLNKASLPRTVMRFSSLALAGKQALPDNIPLPRLATNMRDVSTCLDALNLKNENTPLLVLCPGAEYGPAKQWPAEHMAALAKEYIEKGWQVWLLGSKKDLVICNTINSLTNDHCNNFAGKTELGQVIDLMSTATAIVSNDSGLMHIAAALNKPLVAIYGSSDPGFTPPLSDKVKILSLNLSCSPCFKRKCPLNHLDCLNKLEPELAQQAIESLLQQDTND